LKKQIRENKELFGSIIISILAGLVSPIAGAVVSLFLALFFVNKREIGILFLFFYLVLFFSDSRSGLFNFTSAIKPILALVFGFAGLLYGLKSKLFPSWLKYFIPFFLWSLIMILFSPVPFQAFQKTLSYILLYLSVPVFLIFLISTEGVKFIKNYFFIVFSLLALGLVFRVVSPEFSTLSNRFRGLLGNPNGLGVFLALQFLLFQVSKKKWPDIFSKVELRWLYLVFLLSLVLSQSRTAMGVLLIFFLLNWIFKYSVFLGVLVSSAIMLFMNSFIMIVPELIIEFGLGGYFRIETLEEGSGRSVAWGFAWENIQENFFVGKGFAYTSYLFGKYYRMLSLLGHQGNAHNSFLTFWLNTGLVGLVLYSLAAFRALITAARNNSIAIPVIVGVLISASFESWLTASLNPFTFVFLMILTILMLDKDDLITKDGTVFS
jgi:O-antigen ligase